MIWKQTRALRATVACFRILVRRGAEARTYAMGGDARGARHGGVFRILLRQTVPKIRLVIGAQTRAVRATVAYSASCCGKMRCG